MINNYTVILKEGTGKEILKGFGCNIVSSLASIPNVFVVSSTEEDISKLRLSRNVLSVESDSEVVFKSNATSTGKTDFVYTNGVCEGYHVVKLKLREYWKRGFTGSGIKVGIIDSGGYDHPDYDIAGGVNGYDSNTPYLEDISGHGTHVTGIMACKHDRIGSFKGVAPDATYYTLRSVNPSTGGLPLSATLVCIDYAIANNLDVLVMSLSGDTYVEAADMAIQAAHNAGITIICASGNQGGTALRYPASYDNTFSIGSVLPDGNRDSSSNYGDTLDFVCYGNRIISTKNDGKKYNAASGTSFACPMFAGIVILYKQIFPGLTREQLYNKIKDNSTLSIKSYELGWGLPQPPAELYSMPVTNSLPKQILYALSPNNDLVPVTYHVNQGTSSSPVYNAIQPKVWDGSKFI